MNTYEERQELSSTWVPGSHGRRTPITVTWDSYLDYMLLRAGSSLIPAGRCAPDK